MLRASFLVLCVVAVSHLSAQPLEITDFAVPGLLKAGENAELQCRYNASKASLSKVYVKWFRKQLTGSGELEQIYQRMPGLKPQSMHADITTKGDDTIELVNLQPKDSGVYVCVVSDVIEEKRLQQELVVFTSGSGVHLNVTKVADGPDEDTDDDVLIECKAHGVAPEPDLVISINGRNQSVDWEMVSDPIDGFYDAIANLTVSREAVEGMEVTCDLFYKNKNVVHVAVRNSTFFTWASEELSTTEVPEVTAQWNTTTESRISDGADGLSNSWLLLVAVAHLLALL